MGVVAVVSATLGAPVEGAPTNDLVFLLYSVSWRDGSLDADRVQRLVCRYLPAGQIDEAVALFGEQLVPQGAHRLSDWNRSIDGLRLYRALGARSLALNTAYSPGGWGSGPLDVMFDVVARKSMAVRDAAKRCVPRTRLEREVLDRVAWYAPFDDEQIRSREQWTEIGEPSADLFLQGKQLWLGDTTNALLRAWVLPAAERIRAQGEWDRLVVIPAVVLGRESDAQLMWPRTGWLDEEVGSQPQAAVQKHGTVVGQRHTLYELAQEHGPVCFLYEIPLSGTARSEWGREMPSQPEGALPEPPQSAE
jgi:hypothetical protein